MYAAGTEDLMWAAMFSIQSCVAAVFKTWMVLGRVVPLRRQLYFFCRYELPALLVAGILVWLDWIIKLWIQYEIPYDGRIDLIPSLRLVHWHNYGASFGLLSDSAGWQRYFFIGVAVLAIVGLLFWFFRLSDKAYCTRWSISLILAGAMGNLIDRMTTGYVVDYILIYYGDWYWPAFNLADSAISIGVAGLVCMELFSKKEI